MTQTNPALALPPERPAPGSAGPLDFEAVYAECFDMVWRYVSFRVPRAMQDDVVQEIFLVVHQRLSSFEGRSSVRAWVAGVARNVVRDQLGRVANRSLGAPLVSEPATHDDPGGAIDRKRAADLVEEALGVIKLFEQLSILQDPVGATGFLAQQTQMRLQDVQQAQRAGGKRVEFVDVGMAPLAIQKQSDLKMHVPACEVCSCDCSCSLARTAQDHVFHPTVQALVTTVSI